MSNMSNNFKDFPLGEKTQRYIDNIPQALQDLECWGLWQYTDFDEKKQKWNKRNVAGYNANTPKAFTSFDTAVDALALGEGDGLAILMQSTPYVCLDIDHVREGGWPEAYALADHFGWWEYSQSGEGLHAFVEDDLELRTYKIDQPNKDHFDLDIISSGLLFVTGDLDEDIPLEIKPNADRWSEIKSCIKKKRDKSVAVAAPKRAVASTAPHELRSMLESLGQEAQDYETFISYGHAIKRWGYEDARGNPELAFEIFNEWADSCEAFEGEDRQEKWAGFDISIADGITIGSIVYAAKGVGWKRSLAVKKPIGDAHIGFVIKDIRDNITAAMVDAGFDSDELPVFWENIEKAEPMCFCDNAGKQYLMRTDGSQVPVTAKHELKIMEQEFGSFVNFSAISAFAEGEREAENLRFSSDTKVNNFIKSMSSAVIGGFWAAVTRWKTVGSMNIQVDMFADAMTPHVDRNVGTFVLPYKGLMSGPDVSDEVCVADYKEHNAFFEKIMLFVIYSRFAVNRKNCYLWIHAESDWGKGFLFASTGVIGGLGIVQSMSVKEIEKALEGAPVGVDKFSMIDQFILWIDEFKGVKAELKMLDNDISASPKNMMRFTAPLFAKVFTSAEDVASLTGEAGVEDQFARRFSYLRCRGKLSQRSVFIEKGMYRYTGAVRAYAAEFMRDKIGELIGLGPELAANSAEEWLRDFHNEHGLGETFENLNDTVSTEAGDIAGLIQDFSDKLLTSSMADVREKAVYCKVFRGRDEKILRAIAENCEIGVHRGVGVVIIRRLSRIVQEWLNCTYDRSEIGKMGWKKRDLCAAVDALLMPDRKGVVTRCAHENGEEKSTKGTLCRSGGVK